MQKATRSVGHNPHVPLVHPPNELVEGGGIHGGVLVCAEQAERVVPFVENLNQLDPVLPKSVELLFIVGIDIPGLTGRIFPQVVAALRGEVIRNEVFAQTSPNRLLTVCDVLQPQPMIGIAVARQDAG